MTELARSPVRWGETGHVARDVDSGPGPATEGRCTVTLDACRDGPRAESRASQSEWGEAGVLARGRRTVPATTVSMSRVIRLCDLGPRAPESPSSRIRSGSREVLRT